MTPSTGAHAEIDRYRENLQGEVDGAALYRLLADVEATPELAEVYRRLASVEERHAELWRSRLREAGGAVPVLEPSLRVRIFGWLAHRFGLFAVGALIPVLPYLFVGGVPAASMSGVLAALGLFASGALGSFFTGQPALRAGLRQVTFGLLAALVTFGLGKLVGTGLGV
jgi:VIT1/CCC1 family predicted Fe2+/Mn2+ transporter